MTFKTLLCNLVKSVTEGVITRLKDGSLDQDKRYFFRTMGSSLLENLLK